MECNKQYSNLSTTHLESLSGKIRLPGEEKQQQQRKKKKAPWTPETKQPPRNDYSKQTLNALCLYPRGFSGAQGEGFVFPSWRKKKNDMHGGEENKAFLLQQIKQKNGVCAPAWINSQRCCSFVNISNTSASVAYVIQTQLLGAFLFLVMTTRAAIQSLIKSIISINITLL